MEVEEKIACAQLAVVPRMQHAVEMVNADEASTILIVGFENTIIFIITLINVLMILYFI